MKTKLVNKLWKNAPGEADRFGRGFEPQDSPDGKGVPFYVAAHMATGWNGDKQNWKEPEAVVVKNQRYRPKRGKVQQIRTVPDVYVEQLKDLDIEREALQQQLKGLADTEQEILRDAFLAGKPLEVEVVKGWTKAKHAEKA